MKLNTTILATLLVAFLGCGDDEKKKREEEKEKARIDNQCEQEMTEIDAALASLNHCEVDTDCAHSGMHPHYGCSIIHHKDEDTAPVQKRIRAYCNGECWDGSTTLRLLDCAEIEALRCMAGKCEYFYPRD